MKLHVYVNDADHNVGQVFTDTRRGRLTSTFSYSNAYLDDVDAYAIDPGLPLGVGSWPSATPLPGALRDAAPDRWGRNLIKRRAISDARLAGRTPVTLTEVHYLLGVSDISRQGALRFKLTPQGNFEHPGDDVPKLVDLPALLTASYSVTSDSDNSDAAVRSLLAMGSASLGGARPKASVRDGDRLFVAKFAHPHDDWSVIAWEKTALDIAADAGCEVPRLRLIDVKGSPVLLTERFDRDGDKRIGYISAMTLCEANDGEQRDYLDIAERLATISADPQRDLQELWRRIGLGLTINNTDDHLRNHGLLRNGNGWSISPVFDINPNPDINMSHATTIGGEQHRQSGIDAWLQTADTFGLTMSQSVAIAGDICDAVSGWASRARQNGVGREEISRFQAVFDQGISALKIATKKIRPH